MTPAHHLRILRNFIGGIAVAIYVLFGQIRNATAIDIVLVSVGGSTNGQVTLPAWQPSLGQLTSLTFGGFVGGQVTYELLNYSVVAVPVTLLSTASVSLYNVNGFTFCPWTVLPTYIAVGGSAVPYTVPTGTPFTPGGLCTAVGQTPLVVSIPVSTSNSVVFNVSGSPYCLSLPTVFTVSGGATGYVSSPGGVNTCGGYFTGSYTFTLTASFNPPAVWNPAPGFTDLGNSLTGTTAPRLMASSNLQAGSAFYTVIDNAPPSSIAYMIVSTTASYQSILGGTLVPDFATGIVLPLYTDSSGTLAQSIPWPAGIPIGTELYLQAWFFDPSGPQGAVATNAVKVTT